MSGTYLETSVAEQVGTVKRGRFVMANRRAGLFGDARLVSRHAMDATLQSVSGINVVSDNEPSDPYARRVVVFEADPAEIKAKSNDPNVLIEPEILHWPDLIPPVDLSVTRHVNPEAPSGASSTLASPPLGFINSRVIVRGGGTSLEGANVTVYLRGPFLSTPLTKTTDSSGSVEFAIRPDATVAALVVAPAGGFWAMVKRDPSTDETIDCPPLPESGPLEWWHLLLGKKNMDSAAGHGIRIGVIDTGCGPHSCLDHARLVGAFINSRSLPPSEARDVDSHGTHVSGIIGARPVRPQQFAGFAPGAELLVARVFPAVGTPTNQGDIANAIDALSRDNSVDLINMSLGSTQASQIEHDVIIDAYERGTLCICAAGNDSKAVNWPGAFPETVAVSALGRFGWAPPGSLSDTRMPTTSHLCSKQFYVANFSSWGPEVLCIGPGVGIISTAPARFGSRDPYVAMDGTSMACPAVCGALAVILSKSKIYLETSRGRARADMAKQLLRTKCNDLGIPLHYQGLGAPSA